MPWRASPTPYRVWISEIMLQQTQVVTVIPYFERFIARFPDVKTLAQAQLDDVLKQWEGLGYYSRARNLHRAAKMICASGEPRFPNSAQAWLEIPGVGPYTAGAIASIAFNEAAAILDGNVERVVSRVFGYAREALEPAAYKKLTWGASAELLARAVALKVEPRVLNQALMELGARVCVPRTPHCDGCAFESVCVAREQKAFERYPGKKPRTKSEQVSEVRHVWLTPEGQVRLVQNPKGQWRAGLWDFPATKPASARRALATLNVRYVVTHHKVERTVHVWQVNTRETREIENVRWESLESPTVARGAPIMKIWPELQRIARVL